MYGITIWGNSSSSNKVFIWQKKALRILKGVPDTESCLPIFKEYKVMTLPCLYIYTSLLNIKETLHLHKTREDIHFYNTRKNYKIDTMLSRLEKTKKSHICMKTALFNKLPQKAWTVSLEKFKTITSEWLKKESFYSVQEYFNSDFGSLKF